MSRSSTHSNSSSNLNPHTPSHPHVGYSPSTSSLPQKPLHLKRPGVHLSRSNTAPTRSSLSERRKAKQENGLKKLQLEEDVVVKLRRWVLGIAVVEFDLDDGPMVSGIYPTMDLLPGEEENIAFLAFPDSLQFDQGSQVHSFRIRKSDETTGPKTLDGFVYGFSHFTQKRDAASKRGYQQSSIVILTQFQYPALFSSLTSTLGPMYQSHGLTMLENACNNISGWPDPTPGVTLELGFLGATLHVEIPHSVDAQQLTETSSFNEKYDSRFHILATSAPFHPPPLLLFESCMANLWSIWECLLLCEPLLVFGSSPAQTSQAVWWLRDLIRPIPIAGDFRPYFTMQDADHSALINRLPPKPGLIMGVTNPFFEKSCNHWPHLLSLGKRIAPQTGNGSPSLGSSAGPAPGWRTKTHKRYISKDRVLLKKLEAACRGDDRARVAASLDLRRHFCSRTTQFITPLARYLNTLIPNPTEVRHARARTSPNGNGLNSAGIGGASSSSLRLKPFSTAQFMESLKKYGSPLPFKSTGKRTEFYERWLKSPAFGAWLVQQENIVHSILNTDTTT
ncbi:hypothetical protein DFP72DRAFT_806147 [Ephemerocybe angulata]|uniref:UDENN domain-containing protein n=1 Tax=Ephemerocybe angulata TaxID=980116 RepID=A0A8H6I6S3_9AGAR|nr:hypothetical protein DFP72DRAFT_806147 [Tulosesus angulatus]